MRPDYKDITNEELTSLLSELIEDIIYRDHKEFKIVELYGFSAIFSDLLNITDEEYVDKHGNIIEGSYLEKWTDTFELCIVESRYDDFCDIIIQELLREERYEVLSELINKNIL